MISNIQKTPVTYSRINAAANRCHLGEQPRLPVKQKTPPLWTRGWALSRSQEEPLPWDLQLGCIQCIDGKGQEQPGVMKLKYQSRHVVFSVSVQLAHLVQPSISGCVTPPSCPSATLHEGCLIEPNSTVWRSTTFIDWIISTGRQGQQTLLIWMLQPKYC